MYLVFSVSFLATGFMTVSPSSSVSSSVCRIKRFFNWFFFPYSSLLDKAAEGLAGLAGTTLEASFEPTF